MQQVLRRLGSNGEFLGWKLGSTRAIGGGSEFHGAKPVDSGMREFSAVLAWANLNGKDHAAKVAA